MVEHHGERQGGQDAAREAKEADGHQERAGLVEVMVGLVVVVVVVVV